MDRIPSLAPPSRGEPRFDDAVREVSWLARAEREQAAALAP